MILPCIFYSKIAKIILTVPYNSTIIGWTMDNYS